MTTRWLTRPAAALILTVQTLPALATPVGDLATATIAFESHISWKAVDPEWTKHRQTWVSGTLSARLPQALGKQVVLLEQALGWKAVEDQWKDLRADWATQTEAATSTEEVATSLLILDENTKWDAVSKVWKSKRDAWIATVKKAGGLF
jgi:hypothetical protein